MLQSEIVDVMQRTGNKPVLDKEAAVKILTFDSNQWVAYDDEDTFQMKADFARKYCMSGIMIWAISGDVSDGTYSKATRKAAARKFTSIPAEFWEKEDDGLLTTVTKHPQCKWTNCGESCPANWIRTTRNDKEARKNEYMVDGSYCSEGVHELCCPPEGDTPTCGWYQHSTMPPQMPGGGNSDNPIQRIFNAIGSQANNQHMVIAAGGLNMAKFAFWTQNTKGQRFGVAWMHQDSMNTAMQNIRSYETFVEHLRNPIIAINYLADSTIWGYLVTMVNDVANELRLLQDFHRAQTGISDDLVGAWHEFIRDLLQTTVNTARDWVQGWIITARNEYRDENGEDVINLLAILSTLLRYAFELGLPLHQLP